MGQAIAKQEKTQSKMSIKRKRFAAALNDEYLDTIMFGLKSVR